ncbi:MAG: sialate O-acetylesterase [Planctomycetota bacterium]|jgi:sialate O-acetylesterase
MERFNRSIPKTTILLFAFLSIATTLALADVKLPHVIGSHMVVQRKMPIPIWGCADPGEHVTVKFADHQANTTADDKGNWMLKLPAIKAPGPYKMTVSAGNTIVLKNILVGEVWLCAGQSNMEMGIGVVANGKEEIAAADYPQIRLFDVPKRPSGQTEADVDAEWYICSPNNISSGGWGGFSAVAYFFGREIHNQLNVPVGLVDASWGGSYIEPWTPPAGFAMVPKLTHILTEIEQTNSDYREVFTRTLDEFEAWIPKARKSFADDGRIPQGMPDYPHHPFTINEPYDYPWRPTGLYNGMIHPLIPFAIRGAIWYQGESNLSDGMLYHDKMKALIGGWRKLWNQGDFPFYFVQLAPFRYEGWPTKDITRTSLPEIWQAQLKSLSIPNTGMAVTTDITELDDIHPHNKQDVGKRLALWALAKTYGRSDLVYSGPLYKSMLIQDATIRVAFDHVGSGLTSSDGKPLTWFEIAGPDRKFYKANAEISGGSVLVWSDKVIEPLAVRFAWHQEAAPNLINKEGLPASPFRTDQ